MCPVLSKEGVVEITQQWVERVVVGLNLCPFARPVVQEQSIRYAVCDASDWNTMRQFVLEEMLLIWEAEPSDITTSLLMFSQGLQDFLEYLEFLELADSLIEDAGLSGIFQVASFHPEYQFDGTSSEDRSNYTNRAPFPTLHLLREDDISRAVESSVDTTAIPERNIQRLLSMSEEEWNNFFGQPA